MVREMMVEITLTWHPIRCSKGDTTSHMWYLAKDTQLASNHEEISDNPKLTNILWNNRLVIWKKHQGHESQGKTEELSQKGSKETWQEPAVTGAGLGSFVIEGHHSDNCRNLNRVCKRRGLFLQLFLVSLKLFQKKKEKKWPSLC